MTKRLLVDYIKEHAQVTDRELDDVQVMEDFSFVTAPAEAAEVILHSFSFIENDGKPIVTKAKPDNPNGKHLAGRHRERPFERRRDPWYDREADSFENRDRYHERPQSFDRRDRYSYPSDRPVPAYAKKGSKNHYKPGGFKKNSRKGR